MTRLLLSAAVALASLPASVAAAVVDIGVAAAVRGKVNATAPGAAGRVVETGKAVFQNDRVSTGADAKLQILLLDESGFTVGPNSEMILDEFVYDPKTSAGKVSARVSKGNFRFVTGKVAQKNPGNMKVATPVATIGIRGTMVAGQVEPGEATIVLLGPGVGNNADEKGGAITVGNEQGSVNIDKDGWGVTVRQGQAPGAPFELSPAQLEGVLGGVASNATGDSQDGSGGGAGDESGDETAAGKELKADANSAFAAAESETSSFAAQQELGSPSVSTWDAVRGIATGTGQYAGSADYFNCTGGTCQSSPAGQSTLTLNIDFGARTLGGAGSTIQLAGQAGVTGNIGSLSYASLGGDASASLSVTGGFGTWTGTSLKLLDVGGVTAGAASVDIRYNDSSTSQLYRGEVTGTR